MEIRPYEPHIGPDDAPPAPDLAAIRERDDRAVSTQALLKGIEDAHEMVRLRCYAILDRRHLLTRVDALGVLLRTEHEANVWPNHRPAHCDVCLALAQLAPRPAGTHEP